MFILYVVLFLGGFYLISAAAFNAEAWQALIFTAGMPVGRRSPCANCTTRSAAPDPEPFLGDPDDGAR